MSELLFKHAEIDLGLREIPGPGSSPRIQAAIMAAAKWLDGDDSKTAWCGCIRGMWGFETGTGVPPEHYRAASWAKWGKPVDLNPARWLKGDTVIMHRDGGNHVALLSHVEGRQAV